MDNHQAALDHFQQGRLSEAISACRQILTAPPANPSQLSQLAKAAHRAGRPDVAAQLLARAIQLEPRNSAFYLDIANSLMSLGRTENAIAAYQSAITLQPNLAEAHCNLGIALGLRNDFEPSIAALRNAIELRPDFPEAHDGLGIVLRAGGDAEAAIESHRRAIQLRPDFAAAHSNLGLALEDLGLLPQAVAQFRRALEISPQFRSARSSLMYAMHFLPEVRPQQIFDEHAAWGRLHTNPKIHPSLTGSNSRDPNRPLRIGYVSADFRHHSVSFFMRGLLAVHDPAAVEIFCYADKVKPDPTTDRIQSSVPNWRDVTGRTDSELFRLIQNDQIDILIDLSGHTGGNRLSVFALKPAPLQATYLGYIDTTGLQAIDYRITDPLADPPGATEAFYTEKLLRLPQTFACYSPPPDAPPVGPLPALAQGVVTFASFNTIQKINPPLLRTWCDLLALVPHARLLIVAKAFKYSTVQSRILSQFKDWGIDPGRITLTGDQTFTQYLALHNSVDIVLDTFPVCGHTVTCHALWMGVPVVSLGGETYCQRLGVSVLTNLGLPQLLAKTPHQYIEIAAGLAADLPRLSQLRATLRDRLTNSPLINAPAFARQIEAAYREIWRRWCAT